jgi:hypothetical protein
MYLLDYLFTHVHYYSQFYLVLNYESKHGI